MIADDFVAALHATMAGIPLLTREPTPEQCPCWCAMKALDDAGQPVDALLEEMAFWELAAWASEEILGRGASAFARLCRAYADEAAAGVAL